MIKFEWRDESCICLGLRVGSAQWHNTEWSVVGVTKEKPWRAWAMIVCEMVPGKHLGWFATEAEARAAVELAVRLAVEAAIADLGLQARQERSGAPLNETIMEALRSHSSPTIDRSDSHGARGQAGYIVWESSIPFVAAAIERAMTKEEGRKVVVGDEVTTILFETRTEQEGVIRLQRWPEGLQLWVGGECLWKEADQSELTALRESNAALRAEVLALREAGTFAEDKEREAFESYYFGADTANMLNNEYLSSTAQSAWEAWAHRAALRPDAAKTEEG